MIHRGEKITNDPKKAVFSSAISTSESHLFSAQHGRLLGGDMLSRRRRCQGTRTETRKGRGFLKPVFQLNSINIYNRECRSRLHTFDYEPRKSSLSSSSSWQRSQKCLRLSHFNPRGQALISRVTLWSMCLQALFFRYSSLKIWRNCMKFRSMNGISHNRLRVAYTAVPLYVDGSEKLLRRGEKLCCPCFVVVG